MPYTIRPLDASTWAVFAELVERNNGIFGGCWCMGYHTDDSRDAARNRAGKQTGSARTALTPRSSSTPTAPHRAGASTAALRNCRASSTGASTRRTRRRRGLADHLFFVDKKHRGQGVARAALEGALDQIAQAGGGRVEAISEVTAGREARAVSCSARRSSCSRTTGSAASVRSASTPGS